MSRLKVLLLALMVSAWLGLILLIVAAARLGK